MDVRLPVRGVERGEEPPAGRDRASQPWSQTARPTPPDGTAGADADGSAGAVVGAPRWEIDWAAGPTIGSRAG